jgi:hypothetical protein
MTPLYSTPLIPVSWGELIDKITILEIKKLNIFDESSLINVDNELFYLSNIARLHTMPLEIHDLKKKLTDINNQLWNIEDSIRIKDAKNEFDDYFIQLAQSVYRLNDYRAELKKSINLFLFSELIEEKSYINLKRKV